MRAIAQTVGDGLGVPVESITEDEACGHFDWLALFVATDNPTSSFITRELVGWRPREVGLLTDVREGDYF